MKSVLRKITYLLVPFIIPLSTFAQENYLPQPAPVPGPSGPVPTVSQGFATFKAALGWISVAFWIFAAIYVFWAAFTYLTANGDPEKIKEANHRFLYAIIAIAVALVAYGLPALVNTFLHQGL